jgi:translation initiation factor eIF-2B subunit gamma
LSRDEEDIEYIAVAFPSESWTENTYVSNNKLPQILFKKPKQDVESDEDMTGSTAKLSIPNARLRGGTVMIRTEWSDVMVYSMAPWVRKLIVARIKNLSSLQEDLLPLLIARQHRGKRAAFGKAGLESLAETSQEGKENEMDTSENDLPSTDKQDLTHNWIDDAPYCVHAILLPSKSALRSNTIAAYLFACKEAVASGKCLPEGSKWNGKFQTLTLKGTTLGGKINMKSTVVGENCSIGDKCRLNNVVIMDEVMLGENCSLQNTVRHCVLTFRHCR